MKGNFGRIVTIANAAQGRHNARDFGPKAIPQVSVARAALTRSHAQTDGHEHCLSSVIHLIRDRVKTSINGRFL